MRDPITLTRINQIHPKLRQEAIDAIEAAEAGFPPYLAIRVVQGFRTWEEQDELYAQGRTKPGKKVTNAKGGWSFHNFGRGLDFGILEDKDRNGTFEVLSWDTARDLDKDGIIDWQEVVKQFEARGWEWGGKWRTFKDYPHVQKTGGKPIAWFRANYKKGEWDNA